MTIGQAGGAAGGGGADDAEQRAHPTAGRTAKSERTREHLIEVALRLFRERGYEASTMRVIAAEARVSPGNAYYHFAGKDDLVQELYVRIQREHRDLVTATVPRGLPLAEALALTWHAGVEVMSPYRSFGTTMLLAALSRRAAVSPFSADSAPAREQAVGLLADVVAGSRRPPPAAVAQLLPRLLWLAYLGITLHWVDDESPGARDTHELIDALAPIIARTIRLARLPVAGGLLADVGALLARFAPEGGATEVGTPRQGTTQSGTTRIGPPSRSTP